MSYLLLLGAGFSRNWGGLLASDVFNHLFSHSEIKLDENLKNRLLRYKSTCDFETPLAELQNEWLDEIKNHYPQLPYFSKTKDQLDKFQSAIE